MSCKGYIVWMEPCHNNWITKREKGRGGFFLISSFVMICHYTTLKTMWLPDFFAVHQITCMPYCIVFYRTDVLHHWQKPCSVPDTFCCTKVSTLLFPVGIFIPVFFLFLPESKYKYTTTTDGETITFEVLDTISEVPAQFVYRVFQNIF